MRRVAIRGETIKLGQLLKLAGVVDRGSEARELLADEPVMVNGERETRRGRRLRPGDTVQAGEDLLSIVRDGGDEADANSPTASG